MIGGEGKRAGGGSTKSPSSSVRLYCTPIGVISGVSGVFWDGQDGLVRPFFVWRVFG
jgi:hypothetical protein